MRAQRLANLRHAHHCDDQRYEGNEVEQECEPKRPVADEAAQWRRQAGAEEDQEDGQQREAGEEAEQANQVENAGYSATTGLSRHL
jgi:hypothetical protein